MIGLFSCILFVISVILLCVGAIVRQPATTYSKSTGGALIGWGVTTLIVSAVLFVVQVGVYNATA